MSLESIFHRAIQFTLVRAQAGRRGGFKSVAHLKWAIMKCLEHHYADPKSLIWTKSAGEIFKKVQ